MSSRDWDRGRDQYRDSAGGRYPSSSSSSSSRPSHPDDGRYSDRDHRDRDRDMRDRERDIRDRDSSRKRGPGSDFGTPDSHGRPRYDEPREERHPIWRVCRTPDGKPYYHNRQTNITQWEMPEELRAPVTPARPPADQGRPSLPYPTTPQQQQQQHPQYTPQHQQHQQQQQQAPRGLLSHPHAAASSGASSPLIRGAPSTPSSQQPHHYPPQQHHPQQQQQQHHLQQTPGGRPGLLQPSTPSQYPHSHPHPHPQGLATPLVRKPSEGPMAGPSAVATPTSATPSATSAATAAGAAAVPETESARQKRHELKLMMDVSHAALELDIAHARTMALEARIQALRQQRALIESS